MFCFLLNAGFVEKYQLHIMPFVWTCMRSDVSFPLELRHPHCVCNNEVNAKKAKTQLDLLARL